MAVVLRRCSSLVMSAASDDGLPLREFSVVKVC
jgi:hypothetical protein